MGILFVVNPKAGNGKAKKVADLIDSKLRGKKVDYKITFTKAPEDATEIVVKNSNLFNRIVSVGGDGTLNEVVNGIVGKDLELALFQQGQEMILQKCYIQV
ncbi:Diacylglycerol kinase catalytic domain-containing protein [Caloramator fervidus]|uniref:Diacylglycerol kinase catalytic domain-containing protein n=1 Tax=Caloramator fervidus TaxID=29344 RepID=A0A1H5XPR9_9CLOT|nr:acylglycerol kinase family protein [Caloramator fervidus]SEG13475.1 Diacylglycerol kinase catalytic domain-containing protein [Caloramator fervidus]